MVRERRGCGLNRLRAGHSVTYCRSPQRECPSSSAHDVSPSYHSENKCPESTSPGVNLSEAPRPSVAWSPWHPISLASGHKCTHNKDLLTEVDIVHWRLPSNDPIRWIEFSVACVPYPGLCLPDTVSPSQRRFKGIQPHRRIYIMAPHPFPSTGLPPPPLSPFLSGVS